MKRVKTGLLIFLWGVAAIIGVACYIIMIVTSFPSSQSNIHAAHFLEELKNGAPKRPLTELTDFAWDKVCFVAPYTSDEQIQEALGVDYILITVNTAGDELYSLIFGLPDKHTLLIPITREFFTLNRSWNCLTHEQAKKIILYF